MVRSQQMVEKLPVDEIERLLNEWASVACGNSAFWSHHSIERQHDADGTLAALVVTLWTTPEQIDVARASHRPGTPDDYILLTRKYEAYRQRQPNIYGILLRSPVRVFIRGEKVRR